MRKPARIAVMLGLAFAVGVVNLPLAQAEDFLSVLFGAFGARPPGPPPAPPFGFPLFGESAPVEVPPRVVYGRGHAWCVRGCDGLYFPITGRDGKGRLEACSSFCPASPTTVLYGGDIDNAVTENGRPYSDLPNAFRYRKELVAGCTCNGRDPAGLAPVSIDKDPTLRKGDIIAGAHGLEIATRNADPRGGANFTPLPRSVQARYRHLPVVAAGR